MPGKFLVDGLVEPGLHPLVVGGIYPDPDLYLYPVIAKIVDIHPGLCSPGCFLIQYGRLLLHEVQKKRADKVEVRTIGDAEPYRKPVGVAFAVVVDVAVRKGAVGNRNLAVVGSDQFRVDDADLRDPSEVPLGLNVVPHLERLESQDDQSAGEILDGSAHGHADGHTSSSQQGGDRSGVDPEGSDHREDQDDPQQRGHETEDERRQGRVGTLLLESFRDDALGLPDQPGPDYIDYYGKDDLETELDNCGSRALEELVCRSRLDCFNQLCTLGDDGVCRKGFRGRGGLKDLEHIR